MAIKKVINSQSQTFQPILTDTLVLDAVPTVNSFNSVTSDAVARAVAGASGEVPQVTEDDNGKVLTAIYDAGGAAVEWATPEDEVPAIGDSDNGKFLMASVTEVEEALVKTAAWSTLPSVDEVPSIGDTDNGKVLTATYTAAHDDVPASSSYAWAAIPAQIPAFDPVNDVGKVLQVTADGLAWVTLE